MFGGAVGGGKTEALLEWLRQGVHIPNFSGLFLRRTYAQLEGSPTTPIERSHKFFSGMGGKYNAGKHVWVFPNGARVRFGHMQHENNKHNFDGPEFHRIAWDQVEQFTETQYTYMFSRLRRTVDYPIECGMRSAANPVGGSWVKQRFVPQEAIEALKSFTAYDPSPPGLRFISACGAVFIPSRVADNPSIEVSEYIGRLRDKLGAVLAAKLANGDWSVVEGAIIDAECLRYFSTHGEYLIPLTKAQEPYGRYDQRQAIRFATVDTAGTSKQRAEEEKGKNPSWSVCAIWDYFPGPDYLFLRHVWRQRVDWKDLAPGISDTLNSWNVTRVGIENAHFGTPLARVLEDDGFDIELMSPNVEGMKTARVGDIKGAKLERAVATGLLPAIEKARFYLPWNTEQGASEWMPEYESELLTWAGKPEETADQIDVSSYGVHYAHVFGESWGGVLPLEEIGGFTR